MKSSHTRASHTRLLSRAPAVPLSPPRGRARGAAYAAASEIRPQAPAGEHGDRGMCGKISENAQDQELARHDAMTRPEMQRRRESTARTFLAIIIKG